MLFTVKVLENVVGTGAMVPPNSLPIAARSLVSDGSFPNSDTKLRIAGCVGSVSRSDSKLGKAGCVGNVSRSDSKLGKAGCVGSVSRNDRASVMSLWIC